MDSLPMLVKPTLISLLTAGLLTIQNAQAALQAVTGNSLVIIDTDLNITWTQDANLFKTMADSYLGGGNQAAFVTAVINSVGGVIKDTPNSLDTPPGSGTYSLSASDFNPINGRISWWGAVAWANYLNSISYGGMTGWRLPTSDTCIEFGCNASELGHLFYTELGGQDSTAISVTHNAGFLLFANIQDYLYWSATEAPNADWATDFWFNFGFQAYGEKPVYLSAWAVRDGQVTGVPLPASVWLIGSALLGLGAIGRRQNAAQSISPA